MTTNKVMLKTKEEFLADYKPVYQPIYPLMLNSAVFHPQEVGKANFTRLNAVGDIRQKHITPKDTELRQIAVNAGSKTFKSYFFANQFQVSTFQDNEGTQDVINQVLDEHQKQMDEIILLGDGGTSAGTVVNNGLYWSGDANYTLESSVEVASTSRLYDLHSKMMTTAMKANTISGQKLLIAYGATLLPYVNSIFDTAAKSFRQVLQETMPGYAFADLPSSITPNSANGWIIVNLDQIKLHLTSLPVLYDQGTNNEKFYNWFNFVMSSAMIDVVAENGIVRQPCTFAA